MVGPNFWPVCNVAKPHMFATEMDCWLSLLVKSSGDLQWFRTLNKVENCSTPRMVSAYTTLHEAVLNLWLVLLMCHATDHHPIFHEYSVGQCMHSGKSRFDRTCLWNLNLEYWGRSTSAWGVWRPLPPSTAPPSLCNITAPITKAGTVFCYWQQSGACIMQLLHSRGRQSLPS